MNEFLVVYDYDTGGVWGVARAESASEIVRAFPELTLMEPGPDWMTADEEGRIRSEGAFDIDDPSTYPGWLRAVIEDREKS